jgi:predicted RNase H-like HicB family nuclease
MRYTVLLRKEAESGGHWAMVPDLAGCYSAGDTLDEALGNVKKAIELHLQGMIEDGEGVPFRAEPFVVASVEVDSPTSRVAKSR